MSKSEISPPQWIGLSAFGIQSKNFQKQPCQNFLKAIMKSPAPAIAVLYKTFGDDNRCLEKYWKKAALTQKPQLTEFHFSNEAGRRAGTMDTMDFYHELDIEEYNTLLEDMPNWFEKDLRARVQEINDLIEPHTANGEFILSTGLEDNYSSEAFENLYEVLASEWPHRIARNIAYTKTMRKQVWDMPENLMIELHGYTRKLQTSRQCIANGDGQDVDFLAGSGLDFRDMKAASLKQVNTWLKKSREKNCITFLWAGKWQGFFTPTGTPKPLSRKFRFDKSDIKIIDQLFNPAE